MIARWLKLQPAAVGATLLMVYSAGMMLYRAWVAKDLAIVDWDIVIAAASAAYLLFVKGVVTPVADPKDNAGRPLTPDSPPTYR